MNKNYLVTVILVTYNAEKYIEDALKSLISRIDEETEVIVVDGLSTDGTINIIKKYQKYISKFISEKDSGIYDAMNKGVALSSGKFILFLGADDKLVINLKELSDILIGNKIIYYGDVLLEPSHKLYGGKFNTFKIINRNICHQSIFFPKLVFAEYQYGSEYKYMEDYVMNLKLWSSKKFNFCYLEETISVYNLTGLSSTNVDSNFKRDSFKIIFKYFGFLGVVIKIFNPVRNFFKSAKSNLS